MKHADVIVLGVGGMGSATCYQLAKCGVRVLGLEQFDLGHAKGSSHGDVRLIRKAYFEEAKYVPLLERSYQLWDSIEKETGTELLHRVGLLIMGPDKGGMALPGLLESSRRYQIPVEIIQSDELSRRYPQFRPPEGYRGVLEPGAGFLEVEKCVLTFAKRSQELGATIATNQTVVNWRETADGVEVKTKSDTFHADRLVITGGPWSSTLLSDLKLPLRVLRVPQFWFETKTVPSNSPCFAFDRPEGFFYGFTPRPGFGLKLAEYKPIEVEVGNPLTVDRNITGSDSQLLSQCVRENLPGVDDRPSRGSVCLYTMTPDENFIVDKFPGSNRVVFAAGFSGHGFKFASLMGEILSELSLEGKTQSSIDFLSASRF